MKIQYFYNEKNEVVAEKWKGYKKNIYTWFFPLGKNKYKECLRKEKIKKLLKEIK